MPQYRRYTCNDKSLHIFYSFAMCTVHTKIVNKTNWQRIFNPECLYKVVSIRCHKNVLLLFGNDSNQSKIDFFDNFWNTASSDMTPVSCKVSLCHDVCISLQRKINSFIETNYSGHNLIHIANEVAYRACRARGNGRVALAVQHARHSTYDFFLYQNA